MTNYVKLCEKLRDEPRYKDKATLEIMDLCFEAADAIKALQAESLEKDKRIAEMQAERDAAVAESNELREDFASYVTDGVQNPSPYCANKSSKCVDGRGWCIPGKCKGFRPSAWRGVQEGET